MKLLILLLFCSPICFGQSMLYPFGTPIITGSISLEKLGIDSCGFIEWAEREEQANKQKIDNSKRIDLSDKLDTSSVILLVIDVNTGFVSSMGFFNQLDQAHNDRRIPFWIIGLEVTKRSRRIDGAHDLEEWHTHVKYLTNQKRNLPKSWRLLQKVNIINSESE